MFKWTEKTKLSPQNSEEFENEGLLSFDPPKQSTSTMSSHENTATHERAVSKTFIFEPIATSTPLRKTVDGKQNTKPVSRLVLSQFIGELSNENCEGYDEQLGAKLQKFGSNSSTSVGSSVADDFSADCRSQSSSAPDIQSLIRELKNQRKFNRPIGSSTLYTDTTKDVMMELFGTDSFSSDRQQSAIQNATGSTSNAESHMGPPNPLRRRLSKAFDNSLISEDSFKLPSARRPKKFKVSATSTSSPQEPNSFSFLNQQEELQFGEGLQQLNDGNTQSNNSSVEVDDIADQGF